MVVVLDPKLEAALKEQAELKGIAPEELALGVLRERLIVAPLPQPQDEWERNLLKAARPWGVALSDDAVGSDGLYE